MPYREEGIDILYSWGWRKVSGRNCFHHFGGVKMRIRVEYDDEEIATHASIDEAEKDILEMNAAGVMPLRVYAIDENGDEIEGQALGCDWNVKITSLGKSSLPRIDLCFTGWLRGVPVQSATVVATGETISVTGMSSKGTAQKM